MPNIQFLALIKWVKYVTISFLIECIWHKSVPFSSHCPYLSSVLTRSTVKPHRDPLLQLFLQFQQKSSNFQNRLNHSGNGLMSPFLLPDEPQTPNRSIKACLNLVLFNPISYVTFPTSFLEPHDPTSPVCYLTRPHTILIPSPLHSLSRFMLFLFLFIALYPCPNVSLTLLLIHYINSYKHKWIEGRNCAYPFL